MNKYILHEKIGTGGYSTVFRCTDNIGIRYACKVLSKTTNKRSCVQQEVDILQKLQYSTKIPRLVEALEDDNSFYIVQEWCKGGQLKEYVAKHDLYGENTVASIARGVLRGVCHIHQSGIIHRDIKAGNILFADKGPDAEVKIVDFGAAINNDVYVSNMVGTPWFMPPEAMQSIYTPSSDVWSIGVLIYQLLSGNMPFNDKNNKYNPSLQALWYSILMDDPSFKSKSWINISDNAKDFVKMCLNKCHKERPSAVECLQHPWLTSTDCEDRFSGIQLSCTPFKYESGSCMNTRSILCNNTDIRSY
jgi:calcium-dependent protein kinase